VAIKLKIGFVDGSSIGGEAGDRPRPFILWLFFLKVNDQGKPLFIRF